MKRTTKAYSTRQNALIAKQNIYTTLERFVEQFIVNYSLLAKFNVYEIFKRLDEHFVSLLSRHSLVRILNVYDLIFIRDFIHRTINSKLEENVEAFEKRDFIYIDDLNELLLKAAQMLIVNSDIFNGLFNESIDLQEV
jgi:nucleoside-diphosphate-sugar epimerase